MNETMPQIAASSSVFPQADADQRFPLPPGRDGIRHTGSRRALAIAQRLDQTEREFRVMIVGAGITYTRPYGAVAPSANITSVAAAPMPILSRPP